MEKPLSLEVKMNEAVRDILLSDRCSSTLLDVTVVKPKELDIFGSVTSNTLRADQVRKLIASMEQQLEERQKLINNLKRDDTIIKVRRHDHTLKKKLDKRTSCISFRQDGFERNKDLVGLGENVQPLLCKIRKSLRNVETKITNMRNINLVISHTTTNESEELIESSKNYDRYNFCPGDHLKNNYVYTTKTEKDNFKSIMIGKKDGDFEKNKDVQVEIRGDNSENDPDISNIAELARKIKILESRLNEQEERAVPRDYLKQIISKLVSNISRKTSKTSKTRSKSDHVLCQGSSKDHNLFVREETTERQPPIICNPVQVEHNFKRKDYDASFIPAVKENSKKTPKDEDEEVYYGGANIWRWGGEILKPGIDLKNKIVSLINEVFGKVMSEKNATKFEQPLPVPEPKEGKSTDQAYNAELFRKFFEQMNAKVFKIAERDTRDSECEKESEPKDKKVKFPVLEGNDSCSKKVDVAYINPKLCMWRDQDSSTSDRVGKDEFMRIISKADDLQREILWNNIWSQAKANGQNKQNIITIKVPLQKKTDNSIEMYETNLTLGEVEAVLMKHKSDSPKKYSDVASKLKKQ